MTSCNKIQQEKENKVRRNDSRLPVPIISAGDLDSPRAAFKFSSLQLMNFQHNMHEKQTLQLTESRN